MTSFTIFSNPFGTTPDTNKLWSLKEPPKRVRDEEAGEESDKSPSKKIKAAKVKEKAESYAAEREETSS